MPPQRLRTFLGPEGLKAKRRALLFIAGMLLALGLTLLPVNWLSARGLLRYPGAWNAAVEWAAFAAALLPTLAASLLERRPAATMACHSEPRSALSSGRAACGVRARRACSC